MPFDVLPHHNIRIPDVQFYHPDARLALGLIEARQKSYDAMLKGLDTILGAVDPANMAKRRLAMMQMQYEQTVMPFKLKQAQLQADMMPLQYEYFRKHGYFPPTTPQGMKAAEDYENQRGRANNFDSYKQTGNPYTTAPQTKTTILHPPKEWNPSDISVTPGQTPPVPFSATDQSGTTAQPPETPPAEQPPPAGGPALAGIEPLQGISPSDEEEEEVA